MGKKLSTSMGAVRARFSISLETVLPFHPENHGPPPTSNAAMLLVTSSITYMRKKISLLNISYVGTSFEIRGHSTVGLYFSFPTVTVLFPQLEFQISITSILACCHQAGFYCWGTQRSSWFLGCCFYFHLTIMED